MQPQRRRDAETAAEGKREDGMRVDEFLARNGPKDERDPLTERIIAAAMEVHREVGPGMTEAMYEEALAMEFDLRGIQYARQVPVTVQYKGKPIGTTRLDFLVEGTVILELKACEGLNAVHRAQC